MMGRMCTVGVLEGIPWLNGYPPYFKLSMIYQTYWQTSSWCPATFLISYKIRHYLASPSPPRR